jgi:hypothetical protein
MRLAIVARNFFSLALPNVSGMRIGCVSDADRPTRP